MGTADGDNDCDGDPLAEREIVRDAVGVGDWLGEEDGVVEGVQVQDTNGQPSSAVHADKHTYNDTAV